MSAPDRQKPKADQTPEIRIPDTSDKHAKDTTMTSRAPGTLDASDGERAAPKRDADHEDSTNEGDEAIGMDDANPQRASEKLIRNDMKL